MGWPKVLMEKVEVASGLVMDDLAKLQLKYFAILAIDNCSKYIVILCSFYES